MEETNENLKAAFLDVVNNQIEENSPPETRTTYKRLISKGYSEQEARELIGAVVSSMMYEMLKNKNDYNEKQYKKNLKRLPKLPWE